MNYTRVTDNVAIRPAPTGSTHAPGWYGPDTTVDYEDMNGIMGEIAAAIVALGGTLDTDVYDQLATQLTETVLTNGRFSDTLFAHYPGSVPLPGDQYGFRVEKGAASTLTSVKIGIPKVSGGVRPFEFIAGVNGSSNHVGYLEVFGGGIPLIAAADSGGGYETEVAADRFYVIDKITGIGGADVIFDDGIEVEGDTTLDGNLDINSKMSVDAATGDIATDGDIEVEGTLTVGSTTDYTVKALSGTVDADDFAGGAEFGQSSAIVNYTDHPLYEITLTISNSNATARDIVQGDTILLNLSSGATGRLVHAHAYTSAGSTNAQKGARWSVSECLDVSDSDTRKIAITQTGKTTVQIGGSGTAETMTVKVLLTYSALTAA